FILGTVLGRIGHGVPAIAIGQHFEDVRPLPRPRMLNGAFGSVFHHANIHAVDLFAGDIEGQPALGEIGGCRGTLNGGAHGVFVVFDHIDDRQVPELGHVEALVNLALVGGSVTEIGN